MRFLTVLTVLIVSLSHSSVETKCLLHCSPPLVRDPTACQCKPMPCPRIRCPPLAFDCDKYKVDNNGCTLCQCLCPSSLRQCPAHCPPGSEIEVITNADGCEVCRCKEALPAACPQTRCAQPCPAGQHRKLDRHGCVSATCRCKPCVFDCNKYCHFGFKLNAMGCPICECKPSPWANQPKLPLYMYLQGAFRCLILRQGCLSNFYDSCR